MSSYEGGDFTVTIPTGKWWQKFLVLLACVVIIFFVATTVSVIAHKTAWDNWTGMFKSGAKVSSFTAEKDDGVMSSRVGTVTDLAGTAGIRSGVTSNFSAGRENLVGTNDRPSTWVPGMKTGYMGMVDGHDEWDVAPAAAATAPVVAPTPATVPVKSGMTNSVNVMKHLNSA